MKHAHSPFVFRASTAALALAIIFSFSSTSTAQQLVMGTGPATVGVVRVLDPVYGDRSFQPYGAFGGGVRVAQGDVNGDGVLDIITGAGPGGGPHVLVFDGATLGVLASFMAYDPRFPGGVFVAAGDVNGDGLADIITGAGAGGGPHVRVFSGADLSELHSFFAYAPFFPGGVSVAAGDVNGDGLADIVTGAGPSGGPHVIVYSGADLAVLASFYAYHPAFPGGVNVATGDVDGDGRADIVTGAGPGGGPHVRVFSGVSLSELASYFAYDPAFPGGVTVAAGDYDQDGAVDVITGPGWGGGPHVRVFSGDGTRELAGFMAFTSGGSGAFVGAHADAGLRITSAAATTFTVGEAGTFTITTAGRPTPSLTMSGTLPAGVTFVGNSDGTGTLGGTPVAGTGGTHTLTFTAANGVLPNATQTFTLTINELPAITSAATATFTIGTPGSFTVTTSGFPAPAIARGGVALPNGLTFTDNADGTGTLSGTPAPGTGGTYAITLTASNAAGTGAAQTLAITVNGPSAFTSASSTTFTAGSPGSFTVTAAGTPAPTITLTGGTLPAGVTFTSATGVLSGTPAAGTGGVYGLTFTASNGVGPDSTQAFTLTVNEAPAITSGAAATFTIGMASSFTVTTTGFPAPSIARGGSALPSGVNFVDNGNGTGTLSGTPVAGTGGTYVLTFTATNTVGSPAAQTFTLTVSQPPAFTSAATATFTVGSAGSFPVTAAGSPAPAIIVGGALPAGVTFVDHLDGTGVLGGTPAAGTGGAYALTFTASNGVLPDATQPFTLNIHEAPAITSANTTTFTVGSAGAFTVLMTGFPAPTVSVTAGTLPAGVTLSPAGVLSGTPDPGTGGLYNLTLTATNGVGANAVQTFALTVNQAPAFTSAAATTFTVGAAGTFSITTSGFPAITTITRGGVALPAGVTYTDHGTGTATLAGTPAPGTAGTYALTFTISNGVGGDVVQNFTLTINEPPAITSAASTTFTVGTPGTFTVTTTGFPTPAVSQTGTLPTGVTFTPATKVLAGTATQTGAFPLVFTATNGLPPDATQNFTLNVVCPAITVTPTSLPEGLFQTPYGPVDFNQTGSTGSSFTWSATGPLAGLGIDPATGIVSGTPTTTVNGASVTITVTDNFGCQGSVTTSLTIRPVAGADSYTGGVGNTQFVVGTAVATPAVAKPGTVKDNDSGPGPLMVTFNAPANGAVAEGPTDGTFVYTPNAGFGGPTDTFTYTLTDGNGVTNTGTVTIALSGMVWYVNNSGGAGDGRSHNPFNTLNAAAAASAAGSQIYVHTGTGTTTGSLALDANQTLHGAGAAFALNDLVIAAGTRPTLSGTVTLANNTVVRGVNFSGAATALSVPAGAYTAGMLIDQVNVTGGTTGLQIAAATGAAPAGLTVSNAQFANLSGAEVSINGGNLPVTFPSTTISSNTGTSISIQNRTGGTVTFAGPISVTGGTGISLTSNPGTTIAFSGGLALSTGANPAFTATGGGTVTATQNNTTIVNTIATTTAVGLNVANTTIGAAGLTFRSINVDGAPNGVVLNNTGGGSLTVTGNSAGICGGQVSGNGATVTAPAVADCTGGTLSTTGAGFSLTNSGPVSLTRVRIAGSGDDGIAGSGVGGLTLISSLIENAGNAVGDRGIDLTNLSGNGGISNSTVRGSAEHNVVINNTSATLTSFNVTNSQFSTNSIVTGDDGILLLTDGTGNITASITQSAFTDNKGDHFQAATTASATGTINVTFSNNTLVTTPANDPNVIGGGITISPTGSADLNFTISNNNIQQAFDDAINLNLGTASTPSASMVGTISNNTIGTSGSVDSGSESSNTITVSSNGFGTTTVAITNNVLRQYGNGSGIHLDNKEGSSMLNATVTGNTIEEPGTFGLNGIHLNNGATAGPPADAGVTCLAISGNTVINGGLATADIRLRQRFNTSVRLPGYAGGNSDTTAVNAFVSANNGGAEVTSVHNVGGGGLGFVGGAPCTTP